MRRFGIKPITIAVHPSLYEKMEGIRKEYRDKLGINLSQVQLTDIIARKTKIPTNKKLDLIGGSYVNAKKSRPY
jgi:hypothetical protein